MDGFANHFIGFYYFLGEYKLTDLIRNISNSEIAVFVKSNSSYYIKHWHKIFVKQEFLTINWIVLFLPHFWFGYRKMYSTFFTYFGIVVLMNFVTLRINSYLLIIIINIFYSLLANPLYFKKMESNIKKLKNKDLSKTQYLLLLSEKGGTSIMGMLITSIITISSKYIIKYIL